MKYRMRTLALVLVALLFVTASAPWSNAQIMNAIRAHVDHSFIIGNTTLPSGEYTFRMMGDSDLQVMTATNDKGNTTVEFIVRNAIDDHTPRHSELVFRKYENIEFLSKIFEGGSTTGAEITETSRQEARLAKHMQNATEHTEEQK